jgi:hypothetical protein
MAVSCFRTSSGTLRAHEARKGAQKQLSLSSVVKYLYKKCIFGCTLVRKSATIAVP